MSYEYRGKNDKWGADRGTNFASTLLYYILRSPTYRSHSHPKATGVAVMLIPSPPSRTNAKGRHQATTTQTGKPKAHKFFTIN